MSTIIEDMITLANYGPFEPGLQPLALLIGPSNCVALALELVGWITWQHNWRHEKPLALELAYEFPRVVARAIRVFPALSELFEIKGDECNFRTEVSPEERRRIRELVAERYKPTVMGALPSGGGPSAMLREAQDGFIGGSLASLVPPVAWR